MNRNEESAPPPVIGIIRAVPDDAAVLTGIAFAAKRHWGYPEKWIENWRETLTVRPQFIADHETHAALFEGRIIGFYALGQREEKLELLHLWVLPEVMGRGIGRTLFAHALRRVRALGFLKLEIESDPNAEAFYRRMGARRTGTTVTDWEGQRRDLPVLVYEINCGDELRDNT
jgi:GNAT superfamily N-acetyltransferase